MNAALFIGGAVGAWYLLFHSRSAGATPAPPSRLDTRIRRRVEELRATVDRENAGNRYTTTALVLAVIARESGGESRRGADGERGVMQVTREAWQDYQAEKNDPDAATFDTLDSPDICIRVGSWFLDQKIWEFRGDRYNGLRAYNCGFRGASDNAACGATYASWIIEQEPQFRGGPV